ncbi:hypothetical protein PF005_g20295 [Phytophthora fragariae]|uniref:PDZ domain-containing protein n=1 Tax=Phytophthora fragariae TaxID=53985 RepID=A0A6A3WMY0_9STRA|nr:hypothetical protein PF003_g19458 [Phytophthora fragariae]KAE8928634.1 hypothetical protein PF009_g21232 [Phytophthora fragariae]KAE8988655.1 hypothetical protein PF011_g19084 [Phytophthora fragariae]KAE9087502.1 hypothetical protein PF007_g20356 [Phytophthora fragariae]KAE9087710.1 hypothetical protein PF010_g19625 [Phytophthora fragariae]
METVRLTPDLAFVHRRSSASARQRHRSSSSSSLSVSACSISSTVSSFPAPALRPSRHLAADQDYEDYEVVFTEDKLGLTLKSQEQVDPSGYRIPVTIVKSTIFSVGQVSHQIREGDVLQSVNGESIRNLEFPDVLRILKIAPRPIRLRFRTRFTLRWSFHRRAWSVSGDEQQEASRRSSTGSADSELRMPVAVGPFAFPGLEEDGDDSDSQNAVMSESFGDADSARSTENSSVIADCTDTEFKSGRQSRLAAFLRKPFRRGDGFDGGRWELRMGIVPASPRAEVVLESPSKAAILVRWRANPNAVSYHLQFSRDWTMKVWKSWSGRPQRSSDNEHELVTSIFGLDYSKSYVVRVRYEFSGGNGPSEWSSPSAPITTTTSVDAIHHRIAPPRTQRG